MIPFLYALAASPDVIVWALLFLAAAVMALYLTEV